MTRPAFANLIERTGVVFVEDSYQAAKAANDDGPVRTVGADPAETYEWDWADTLTLCFLGRIPTRAPWDAMQAGAESVFFVDLDGEMQQWKRA